MDLHPSRRRPLLRVSRRDRWVQEEVRKASMDYALMLEWFDRVGYNADIPSTSKESGIAPTTLPEWAGRAAWA